MYVCMYEMFMAGHGLREYFLNSGAAPLGWHGEVPKGVCGGGGCWSEREASNKILHAGQKVYHSCYV